MAGENVSVEAPERAVLRYCMLLTDAGVGVAIRFGRNTNLQETMDTTDRELEASLG